MGKCAVTVKTSLSRETMNKVKSTHQNFTIEGLTSSEQREVTEFLSAKMYSKADTGYTIKELKASSIKFIKDKIAKNNSMLEKMAANPDFAKKNEAKIIYKQKSNILLNSVIDNMDALVRKGIQELDNLQGVDIDKSVEAQESDLISATDDAMESSRERTSFGADFSLELDSYTGAPGKLKAFLAYIIKKEFIPGEQETLDMKTFFNTEKFLGAKVAYDELHRLLEGVYPSTAAVMERLNEHWKRAQEEENSSLAWLGEFITTLEGVRDNDPTLFDMFVRDMAKHQTNMFYTFYIETPIQGEPGKYTTHLVKVNDNSASAFKRVAKLWENNHMAAPIVNPDSGEYEAEEWERINNLLVEAKNFKGNDEARENAYAVAMLSFFSSLGMEVPMEYITALAKGEAKIKINNKLLSTSKIIANMQLQFMQLVNVTEEGIIPKKVDFSLISSATIAGLAKGAVKFGDKDQTNVMRVGDKLIYTYTANHNFSSRIRDLKNKGAEDLKGTIFSNRSLYGEALRNDATGTFKGIFGMSYVSLYPLVNSRGKGRNLEGITKIAPIDAELMSVGYAFKSRGATVTMRNFTLSDGTAVQVDTQEGSHVTPTMSDKTRAMLLDGYTFRVTKEVKLKSGNVVMLPDQKAIKLYVDKVVMAEVDRIKVSDEAYVTKLNLASYKGDLFYLSPYLNNVFIDALTGKETAEGEENAMSLPEYLKLEGQPSSNTMGIIEKNVLNYMYKASIKRYNSWVNLGLVDSEGNFSKHKGQQSNLLQLNGEINPDTKASAMELAIDMTYSLEMSNANFFQLIAGDPAQYHKQGKVKSDKESDINNSHIEGTYSVITKRLASEIAPGDDANTTGQEDYYQVFLDDIYSPSDNIEDIIEILDSKEARIKYEKLVKDVEKGVVDAEKTLDAFINGTDTVLGLISAPYFRIATTDAQEYVTWQTHVDEMLRYGELSKEEHKLIYDTVHTGIPKDLLKKVLGPRKPVHSSSVITKVDNLGEVNKVMRKTYIKSSAVPLLPQVVKALHLAPLTAAMEELENRYKKEGGKKRGVRAAYKTAVKVGFPAKSINLLDENGEFKSKIVLSVDNDTLVLRTDGLRNQQSVKFDPKKKDTTVGSQEKKLLFSGIRHIKDFLYKGKKLTGAELEQEYLKTYAQISEVGLETFEDYILKPGDRKDRSFAAKEHRRRDVDKVDYRKLASILKRELKSKKKDSKPALDGLKVKKDGSGFVTPLWQSAYADEYMALLNSIVSKATLKKRMPGVSAVLLSEAGMSEKAGSNWRKGGILYKEGFDPTQPLQGQRLGKDGEILPAQVILPFKFQDSEGNLLDVEDFMLKDENGEPTGVIDVNKLPKELMEAFSFRIPTQLQQSMAFVEIVGFMPYTLGDSVIAAKEFIVQMGSDFDVDKLYNYIYGTTYKDGVLAKAKSITVEEREERINAIEKKLDILYDKKIESIDKSTTKERKNKIKEEVQLILLELEESQNLSKEEAKKVITAKLDEVGFGELKKIAAKLVTDDKILALEKEKKEVTEEYLAGLHNDIIDIHKAVMLNREAQPHIMAPLGSENFETLANTIKELRQSDYVLEPITSHAYNTKKMTDGNAGMDGISIFSSDSILQASLEGKDVRVGEYVTIGTETTWEAIHVEFGEGYDASDGHIGLTTSLKNSKVKSSPAKLISATQNISVDNANLEAMAKINMNTTTASVYTFLHLLGFEDDISTYFMSQPILFEYVQELVNSKSAYSTGSKSKEVLIEKLLTKYANRPAAVEEGADPKVAKVTREAVNVSLASFKDEDAVAVMGKAIDAYANGKETVEQGELQAAILVKFLQLEDHAKSVGAIKKYLNLDSKGLNKNFLTTSNLVSSIDSLPNSPILNLSSLIGAFTHLGKGVYKFTEPTTLAGFDVTNGLFTLDSYFGNEFIESNTGLRFTEVIEEIKLATDGYVSEDMQYEVRNEYKNYLNSDLTSSNSLEMRKELIYNTKPGSLYANLLALRKTEYAKNNKFLSNLSQVIVDKTKAGIIDFDIVPGDTFNNNAIYESYVEALLQGPIIETEAGNVNVSLIMQQLAYYGVLKGGRAGKSFTKFIPQAILQDISTAVTSIDTTEFVVQYFQNNPDKVTSYSSAEVIEISERVISIKKVKSLGVPKVVKYANRIYIQDKGNTYVLGKDIADSDISTYDKDIKGQIEYQTEQDKQNSIDSINVNDLSALHGMKATSVFPLFKDASLTTHDRALKKAYSSINSATIIEIIHDPHDTRPAYYSLKENIITINKAMSTGISQEGLFKDIAHEMQHALSVDNLNRAAKSGKLSDSIVRIQENIETLINKFTQNTKGGDAVYDQEKEAAIRTYVYSTYSKLNKNSELLQNIINLTTHPLALQALHSIKNGKTLDVLVKEGMYLPIDQAEEVINNSGHSREIMYAITSIYEYVAVVPTVDDKLKEIVGANYPSFINNLRDFVLSVLEQLGITDAGVRRALADVYEVSDLVVDTETLTEKKEIPSVAVGASLVTMDAKGRIITDDNRVITLADDAVTYNTAIENFVKYYEEGIKDKSVTRLINPEVVLNTKDAHLLNKIYAYASLQNEDKGNYAQAIGLPTAEVAEAIIEPTPAKPSSATTLLKKLREESNKSTEDNSLSDSTDDIASIDSLSQMGKELMKECTSSGKKANSPTWRRIQGRPSAMAKNGMYIKNTNEVGTGTWKKVDAKPTMSAANGMYMKNKRKVGNGTWSKVTKLKGPSHSKGGIDIAVTDGKVSYTRGGAYVKAANGLVIPNDSFIDEEIPKIEVPQPSAPVQDNTYVANPIVDIKELPTSNTITIPYKDSQGTKCTEYSGCVRGGVEDMAKTLNTPVKNFRKSSNLYGDAWGIMDNSFGEFVDTKDNYNNVKSGDIVSLTRDEFESDKEKGIPNKEQHFGYITKIEEGIPYIRHYIEGKGYYEEPLNDIKEFAKYSPERVKRLDALKDIEYSTEEFKSTGLKHNLQEKDVVESMNKDKRSIQEELRLDSDEYNNLAKLTYGIIGAESNFGDSKSTAAREVIPDIAIKAVKTVKGSYNKDYRSLSKGYSSIKESSLFNISDNRNIDIKELQRQVGLTGSDVDGIYGSVTKKAVDKYNETAENKITYKSLQEKLDTKDYTDLSKERNYVGNALQNLGVDINDLNNPANSFKATLAVLAHNKKLNPNITNEELLKKYTGKKNIEIYSATVNSYINNLDKDTTNDPVSSNMDKIYGYVAKTADVTYGAARGIKDKVIEEVLKSDKVLPINIKALIAGTTTSSKGFTITEELLSNSAMEELKSIVRTNIKNNKYSISYEDYGINSQGNVGGDSNLTTFEKVLNAFTDEKAILQQFLGQATIKDLGNNEYEVTDTYDFNNQGESFGVVDDIKKRGSSPYNIVRSLGTNYGKGDKLGNKVSIKIKL